jgi:signal transduction histidine kinase
VNANQGPGPQNQQLDAESWQSESAPADSESLYRQARLASDEREAAIRAISGRLAHQIRNPLSAVRAACSGLLHEVDDAEQRETLALSIQEIDKMLDFVAATVRSTAEDSERAMLLDPGAELMDVISSIRQTHRGNQKIAIGEIVSARCRLPRHGLRAALFSLINQLLCSSAIEDIGFAMDRQGNDVSITIAVGGADLDTRDLAAGMITPAGWGQPLGLLVAERFLRSVGGRMTHGISGSARAQVTLELPCDG